MENEACVCCSAMLMIIIWLMNEMKRDACEYGKWLIKEVKREVETVVWRRGGYVMEIESKRKCERERMCVVW